MDSRGNIIVIWERIRVALRSFVLVGAIVCGNYREIQSWYDTIKFKGIGEEVINFPVLVLSYCNFPVRNFL